MPHSGAQPDAAVEVVPFLDDVAGAMAAATCWCRAPAPSPSPRSAPPAAPSLLLPLAIAQGHQRDNARLLAEAGGAEVLAGDEATPERLAAVLGDLLAEPARLARMGQAARALARPDAVRAIADHLEDLLPLAPTPLAGEGR